MFTPYPIDPPRARLRRRLAAVVAAAAVAVTGLVALAAPAFALHVAGTPLAYVVNNGASGSVSVLDTASNMIVATIPVGSYPAGIALNSAGTEGYVVNDGAGTVSVIDLATDAVTATIGVGANPLYAAVTPDDTQVFVTNDADGTVSVIDTSSNQVTATIPVGSHPNEVAVSPDGTQAFVANGGDGTVSVISTSSDTVTGTIPVDPGAYGVAFDASHGTAYVTNTSGTVSVIDTASDTVTGTITLGGTPFAVAVSPDDTTAYVTDTGTSTGLNSGPTTVSVISTSSNTVTATIPVGNGPYGVALTPNSSTAYVTNVFDGTVSVIDTGSDTVTATVPGVNLAYGIAMLDFPAQPVVTSVSPATGPVAGGTTVTITGTGLAGATAITFDGPSYFLPAPATNVSCSQVSCTATAPAGPAGAVDVQVTAPGGTSATGSADQFSYVAAPVITGITPTAGPLAGGNTVTIAGTGLANATAVTFGAAGAATDVSCTASSCTVTAPAASARTVDVTVTTAGGTTAVNSSDKYTYTTAPVIDAISPYQGPLAAGTVVTITGSNLAAATAITFGADGPATSISCTQTSCTATAPAGTAGTVDIKVTAPTGTNASNDPDKYTYLAVPVVTGISPSAGPLAAGTTVTISGTGLSGATAITFDPPLSFGTNPATNINCTAKSCTVTAPAGAAGTVDVQVTTIGGTSATSSADQYTYTAAPAVTAVSPSAGPITAGTIVTITGTNLTGTTAITFGTAKATTVSCTATVCTGKAPAGVAGTVDVQVTTPGGSSATSSADQYTYLAAPTVTAVSPSAGPITAGTTVTITGTNLTGATAITFGTNGAASGISCTATSCTALAPSGAAGAINVTVTTAGGTSATSSASKYTYTAPPVITKVSPATGSVAGGTTVTVTGTNLASATAITFGPGNNATSITCGAKSCTATSPSGIAPGTVDVQVTTAGGTSATTAADQYTYTGITFAPFTQTRRFFG